MTEERDIQTAINFMRNDQPVPLDIVFRLAEAGVDFSDLEERYALNNDPQPDPGLPVAHFPPFDNVH